MNSVAIIGGGITGLTAAFRLQQKNLPVTLYEAGGRVGGVIQSVQRDGYLAECGPNTILETSPKIGALIRELGLERRRLEAAERAGKRYLVRGGKPVALPDSLRTFLATRLFSTAAKLRLAAEPFIRRAPTDREESVAEFVQRRLGREFLDYAINPLVAGVYAGDPARLSVKHAFPKLHALEQKFGSLILGQLLGARERRRRAEVSKQSAKKFSFDAGLQVLPDTLCDRLADAVQLHSPVTGVDQTAHGWAVTARVAGEEIRREYGAVLFAGTAHALAALPLRTRAWLNLSSLAKISYPPVASVVLGFRRADVAHPLDGFGMLIPEVEGFKILGTIFSSSLFPNRAPAGNVTVTSYVGGARNSELALRDPAAVVEATLEDLRKLLGVTGRPTFQHHVLFPRAIPQYDVGYGRFKDLIHEAEAKAPGLFLAGHYRDGISLADSIVSGQDAAERIENFSAMGRFGRSPVSKK